MIHSIQDFVFSWGHEIEATQKVFKHLTDKSLSQELSPNVRNPGRLAWHITQTIPPDADGGAAIAVPGP